MKTPQPCSKNRSKGLFWLFVVAGIGVAILLSAQEKPARYVAAPPVPESLAKSSPRRILTVASESGIVSGAEAAREELARKFGPSSPQFIAVTTPADVLADNPRVKSAIRLTKIRSDAPHLDQKKAELDAVFVAQQRLVQELQRLSPPIHTVPSIETIQNEFINKPNNITYIQPTEEDRRLWAEKKLEVNRVWAEIDVLEVNAAQLRQLRSAERLEAGFWGLGVGLILIGAISGFVRADAWTKGYLTTILGVTFAAAAAVGVALMILFR